MFRCNLSHAAIILTFYIFIKLSYAFSTEITVGSSNTTTQDKSPPCKTNNSAIENLVSRLLEDPPYSSNKGISEALKVLSQCDWNNTEYRDLENRTLKNCLTKSFELIIHAIENIKLKNESKELFNGTRKIITEGSNLELSNINHPTVIFTNINPKDNAIKYAEIVGSKSFGTNTKNYETAEKATNHYASLDNKTAFQTDLATKESISLKKYLAKEYENKTVPQVPDVSHTNEVYVSEAYSESLKTTLIPPSISIVTSSESGNNLSYESNIATDGYDNLKEENMEYSTTKLNQLFSGNNKTENQILNIPTYRDSVSDDSEIVRKNIYQMTPDNSKMGSENKVPVVFTESTIYTTSQTLEKIGEHGHKLKERNSTPKTEILDSFETTTIQGINLTNIVNAEILKNEAIYSLNQLKRFQSNIYSTTEFTESPLNYTIDYSKNHKKETGSKTDLIPTELNHFDTSTKDIDDLRTDSNDTNILNHTTLPKVINPSTIKKDTTSDFTDSSNGSIFYSGNHLNQNVSKQDSKRIAITDGIQGIVVTVDPNFNKIVEDASEFSDLTAQFGTGTESSFTDHLYLSQIKDFNHTTHRYLEIAEPDTTEISSLNTDMLKSTKSTILNLPEKNVTLESVIKNGIQHTTSESNYKLLNPNKDISCINSETSTIASRSLNYTDLYGISTEFDKILSTDNITKITVKEPILPIDPSDRPLKYSTTTNRDSRNLSTEVRKAADSNTTENIENGITRNPGSSNKLIDITLSYSTIDDRDLGMPSTEVNEVVHSDAITSNMAKEISKDPELSNGVYYSTTSDRDFKISSTTVNKIAYSDTTKNIETEITRNPGLSNKLIDVTPSYSTIDDTDLRIISTEVSRVAHLDTITTDIAKEISTNPELSSILYSDTTTTENIAEIIRNPQLSSISDYMPNYSTKGNKGLKKLSTDSTINTVEIMKSTESSTKYNTTLNYSTISDGDFDITSTENYQNVTPSGTITNNMINNKTEDRDLSHDITMNNENLTNSGNVKKGKLLMNLLPSYSKENKMATKYFYSTTDSRKVMTTDAVPLSTNVIRILNPSDIKSDIPVINKVHLESTLEETPDYIKSGSSTSKTIESDYIPYISSIQYESRNENISKIDSDHSNDTDVVTIHDNTTLKTVNYTFTYENFTNPLQSVKFHKENVASGEMESHKSIPFIDHATRNILHETTTEDTNSDCIDEPEEINQNLGPITFPTQFEEIKNISSESSHKKLPHEGTIIEDDHKVLPDVIDHNLSANVIYDGISPHVSFIPLVSNVPVLPHPILNPEIDTPTLNKPYPFDGIHNQWIMQPQPHLISSYNPFMYYSIPFRSSASNYNKRQNWKLQRNMTSATNNHQEIKHKEHNTNDDEENKKLVQLLYRLLSNNTSEWLDKTKIK